MYLCKTQRYFIAQQSRNQKEFNHEENEGHEEKLIKKEVFTA